MFWLGASASEAVDRDPTSDFWYQSIGNRPAAGAPVTPDSALALPAVYAASRVISDSIMQIPLIMYRRTGDFTKERATDHPLYRLLSLAPNEVQTSAEWREIKQHHMNLRGNSFCFINHDDRGAVERLGMPIHPDHIKPKLVPVGSQIALGYEVKLEDGDTRTYRGDEILHMRALGIANDGISGLGPIEIEREAVSTGLAAQDFQARFLANDATPGGIVEHPANFQNDEQRENFKKAWREAYGGKNRRKVAVLEYGLKFNPIDVKLVDAEFLAQRKYTNMDIARIFRVPPHMIMELDRATFSNIAQQGTEFVKFTMLPWCIRWEQRLAAQLLTEEEQEEYFFEFLLDGLERGDSEQRSRTYKAGINDGWLTRNEVRRRENLNPLEGLDQPLEPMNMRNPGGENDERMNAFKQSSAEALARKQRQMLQADNVGIRQELLSHVDLVQSFMHCREEQAQAYCQAVSEQSDIDSESAKWPAWEALAVRLLMELT